MWYLGAWFNGGLGSVRLTVGLYLKNLLQPKIFYDLVDFFILFFKKKHKINANLRRKM